MINIFFGIIAGIISALGLGGGTILILLLNWFSNIGQHEIQGINLIFFIPVSLVSIFMNCKNKLIDFKLSKKLIISGIFGAVLGAFLTSKINSRILKRCFGIFLIIIAINGTLTFISQYKKDKKSKNILRKRK